MTLVKRSKFWHYDFWYRGKRYQGTTDQADRDQAARVEAKIKERLRLDRWDLAPLTREDTPTFTAFAEHYLAEQTRKLGRPDLVARNLRMVLAFWGTRPTKTPPVKGGVYHDLRLGDPILDPDWIDRFDAWMTVRGVSGSTKNSYRSALSGMYELALKPRWRKKTRVKENPFRHIDRDRVRRRAVQLSVEELRRWLEQAEPHARLAMAIGALAPKLRLQQVLDLRFGHELNDELTEIRFARHKTSRFAGAQVTAVSMELRLILEAVRKAHPGSIYVVTYRGEPVKSIKRALKSAAKAANLSWGLKAHGVTFHALRHAMATEIARLGGISRVLHAAAMGHADPRTTEQFYTHLASVDERPVMDLLADRLAIGALVADPAGTLVGTGRKTAARSRAKRPVRRKAAEAH
jgi:integrase